MLTQEKPLITTSNFTEIRFRHDPDYIEFKDWLALNYLEGRTLPDTSQLRTLLCLNNQGAHKITRVEIHSILALGNHSSFPLMNLSIFCRRSGENIFSISQLPNNKIIQFKFIKPGSYDVCYFPAGTPKPVEQWVTVTEKLPSVSSTPYNFSKKIKPSWI